VLGGNRRVLVLAEMGSDKAEHFSGAALPMLRQGFSHCLNGGRFGFIETAADSLNATLPGHDEACQSPDQSSNGRRRRRHLLLELSGGCSCCGSWQYDRETGGTAPPPEDGGFQKEWQAGSQRPRTSEGHDVQRHQRRIVQELRVLGQHDSCDKTTRNSQTRGDCVVNPRRPEPHLAELLQLLEAQRTAVFCFRADRSAVQR